MTQLNPFTFIHSTPTAINFIHLKYNNVIQHVNIQQNIINI